MSDLKERLQAVAEKYNTHKGCGGEVTTDLICHGCNKVVRSPEVWDHTLIPEAFYAQDVAKLRDTLKDASLMVECASSLLKGILYTSVDPQWASEHQATAKRLTANLDRYLADITDHIKEST